MKKLTQDAVYLVITAHFQERQFTVELIKNLLIKTDGRFLNSKVRSHLYRLRDKGLIVHSDREGWFELSS